MSMAPKLIATDLDGTLLRSDGSVSEFSQEVLRKLLAKGIKIIAITARPPRWLTPHTDLTSLGLDILCLGGGARWNAAGPATTLQSFSRADAAAIAHDLRAAFPNVLLGFERGDHPILDPGFPTEDGLDAAWCATPVEASLSAVGSSQPVKILALRPGAANEGGPATKTVTASAEDEAFFAKVREVVGDRAVLAYSGSPGLAELFPPTVSKDQALKRMAAELGISPNDVWAFGDQPNDLAMLQWARHGFAVGNANPQLRTAPGVIPLERTNNEDAVARQLAELR